MAFTTKQLRSIYDRTSGYCHLCKKKLAHRNYGVLGRRAAWEVEHSIPKSCGGTDHLNNLFPACIPCNRKKGVMATTSVRQLNGFRCAPLARDKRREAKVGNAFAGGAAGIIIGAIFGPVGIFAGILIGAHLGFSENPDN